MLGPGLSEVDLFILLFLLSGSFRGEALILRKPAQPALLPLTRAQQNAEDAE